MASWRVNDASDWDLLKPGGNNAEAGTMCPNLGVDFYSKYVRPQRSVIGLAVELFRHIVLSWTRYLECGHRVLSTRIGMEVEALETLNFVVSKSRENNIFS